MYLINRILYKFKVSKYANKGNEHHIKTKYWCRWNNYYVYSTIIPGMNFAYIGIPQTILINDNEIRWATSDEYYNILDNKK